MIIDLRELKRSGKTEEKFFFEYYPKTALSDIPETKVDEPVTIQGEIFLIGDHSAQITGEISFSLSGQCTRCLKSAKRSYLVGFDEVAGEEDGYPVVNDKVDLAKIADDAVIMNMPVKFLCKDDCKGICPDCGADLNDERCKCEK